MHPTRQLPLSHRHAGTLDLAKQPLLVLALSLGSLLLFALTVVGAFQLLPLLRPNLESLGFSVDGLGDLARFALIGVALLALMVVVHEGLHGLFFWRYTGSRPTFGLKGLYAYAAAPGWYLPRNQHLVVALAPLVLITLAGMLLLLVVPAATVLPVIFVVALNIGGAVGDLVVALWLLRAEPNALVEDTGDAIALFRQEQRSLEGAGR